MPSFHIELMAGSGKSEVNYLNGAVFRIGKKYGLDTPVNQVLTETLLAITQNQLPGNTYDHKPEQFLALFPDPSINQDD